MLPEASSMRVMPSASVVVGRATKVSSTRRGEDSTPRRAETLAALYIHECGEYDGLSCRVESEKRGLFAHTQPRGPIRQQQHAGSPPHVARQHPPPDTSRLRYTNSLPSSIRIGESRRTTS